MGAVSSNHSPALMTRSSPGSFSGRTLTLTSTTNYTSNTRCDPRLNPIIIALGHPSSSLSPFEAQKSSSNNCRPVPPLLTPMSFKYYGYGDYERRKLYRRIFYCAVAIIILILIIILVIWLVLRPTKPSFYLQDATVLNFNLTVGPNLLTSALQVTLSSRNPNAGIGIFYDKLDVYAVYKNQQITMATGIPPYYQGHNDVDVWSPYLHGTATPIAPYLATALTEDENAGFLILYVRLDGRVRWKVGTWTSGDYDLDVSCPAFLSVDGGKGNGVSPTIRFQQLSTCSVGV